MSFFRRFFRSCSYFAPVTSLPTLISYRPVTPTKPAQKKEENDNELLNSNGFFTFNPNNISNHGSFGEMQICSWDLNSFQPELNSKNNNKNYSASARGKQNVINSNKKRTGVKKNRYNNNFKLEICDYRRENGGKPADIRLSNTYKHYVHSCCIIISHAMLVKKKVFWIFVKKNFSGLLWTFEIFLLNPYVTVYYGLIFFWFAMEPPVTSCCRPLKRDPFFCCQTFDTSYKCVFSAHPLQIYEIL